MDEIRKTQQAIEALEAQRPVLGDEVVEVSLSALRKKLHELQAEPPAAVQQQRKLATILFTDIAGHTALTRDLDPEENMAVIDSALVKLAGVIEQYGGHIARYQGDGFKAVFGLPTAHESDPENAVLAGLALIAAAQAYNQEMEKEWGLSGFNVRVGIDTGLIFAGGVTEAEDTIKGMVVNLAARLESAAEPGSLLISHHTYQHVRGVFDVEALAPIQAKGFPQLVPVYRVLRAKTRAFRMARRGVENIDTRTIGRDKELQALQEAYRTAVEQKKTTVVTLVGEAGVGKSRLVYEFSNWLDLQPGSVWFFKGRASQQTQGLPQFLLRDLLAGRFEILDSDPLEIVRRKFTDGIHSFLVEDAEMKAHILGAWLGYDFGDSPHLQPMKDEPEQVKHRAMLYLAQFFSAAMEKNPAVMILDDIHWADGSSLEATIDLARRRPDLPLLVVCLARPSYYERAPDWGAAFPAHTRLDLEPLSAEASRSLVEEILRLVDPLPRALVDLVSARAEGNPFYAEELVKMLIDDGIIRTSPEVWSVALDRLAALEVPPTLTGVLQARLDKLQPGEKQAVQEASVIGRIFWDRALAALAAEAPDALPTLQAKEFIFSRSESAFAGTHEYIFKHAILRDVTYETVLKRIRGKYHSLIADWLAAAADANGRCDEYAAMIGEHYQLAGDTAQAGQWYGRAGQQAARTYAHKDAIRYFTLALDFTSQTDDATRFNLLESRVKAHKMLGSREAQREDLAWLETLAENLGEVEQAKIALLQADYKFTLSNFQAVLTQAKRALTLGKRSGNLEAACESHLKLGTALRRLGQTSSALEHFKTGQRLAEEAGNEKLIASCLRFQGLIAGDLGDYPGAVGYYEQALTIQRRIGHRLGESQCLSNLGYVTWSQGEFAKARRFYEQYLEISQEIGNRSGEGMALESIGVFFSLEGNYIAARNTFEQALVIYQQIGDRKEEAACLNNLGSTFFNQGDYTSARNYYGQALEIRREIGDRRGEGVSLGSLAGLTYCEGDYDAAVEYYDQALRISQEIGNKRDEGNYLNGLGDVTLALQDYPKANDCYQQALVIHQDLNQPQYLVGDWAGLAKLRLAQGNEQEALAYGQQVSAYLQKSPRLEVAEISMEVFLFTWEVLAALGKDVEAEGVLSPIIVVIQDYLDKNPAPDIRAMYLRQPYHAALWAAWKARNP